MIKEDGTVIHFTNPKVQASVPANTFSVSGGGEIKRKRSQYSTFLAHLTTCYEYLIIYRDH